MTGPTAVFIGPMGAGKTRIGRRVARALGVTFTDTDKVIVAQHGAIADLFDTHGEPHFRALERAAVRAALAGEGVISLGGGAVLDPETRGELASSPVVYLSVTAEAVEPRLANGKRPLVRGGIDDWQRIYDARRALYEELAAIEIPTGGRSDEQITQDVLDWLEAR